MRLGTIEKTDEEAKYYDVDVSRWLADGVTITGAVATIEDSTEETSTLAAADPEISGDADFFKVFVSGGTAGEAADLKILVTVSSGETLEVNFNVRIKER